MSRRILRWVALGLVATLLAAACGGSDDEPEDAEGSPSGSSSSVPAEEQSSEVDRSSRFAPIDTFCTPAEDEAEEAPEATGPGITESEIVVTHLRSMLEELEDLGFALPVGDTADQVERFVGLINERCGGINGRTIKLEQVDYPLIPREDPAALAQRSCIQIAEDQEATIAISPSGVQGLITPCLTVENEVIFFSSVQFGEEQFEEAGNRLYGMGISTTASLEQMVLTLVESGALEGKTVGVVFQDNQNQPQIVEAGFIDVMEENGIELARADVLNCEGNTCAGGLQQSVSGMVADGVDVLFPLLSILNLPTYLAEMATQGVQPGDFTIYNSAFNSQDSDLSSSKVAEFGGEAAAALYDGATLYSGAPSGMFRTEGYEPAEFMAMCNEEYVAAGGEEFDLFDTATSDAYLMTATVCAMVRAVARAIEAAGPNPTRADLAEAMENLGGIDAVFDVPSSFHPGDHTAPDAIYELTFHFPCEAPLPTDDNTCITSEEAVRTIGRD